MKKRVYLSGIFASISMMLLILDGKCALNSASEGIRLCLYTVVPSLFPFFLLSAVINSALLGVKSSVLRPLGKLCRIPIGSEPLLLLGLLGGYPVGAKNIEAAYSSGVLSQKDATRMLGFCNNAGPAFIFGFLSPFFDNKIALWALWGIHILSALLTCMLLPGKAEHPCSPVDSKPITVAMAMENSLKSIALVCGWVVIFRVIIGFLTRWLLWILPGTLRVLIAGVLELTNGCVQLHAINNMGLRFLLASVFLSLGGVCVFMQTAAVSASLPLNTYVRGKVIQCLVSMALSAVICPLIFGANAFKIWMVMPALILLLLPCCIKKVVDFRKNMVYNRRKSTI